MPEHWGVLGRRGGPDRHRHHHAHGRHLHPVSGDMAMLELLGCSLFCSVHLCLRVLLRRCRWSVPGAEGASGVSVVTVLLL